MRDAVELLYWDGCPSHPQALSELRSALADLGLEAVPITLTEVCSEEEAISHQFVGSPTLRVNGVDVAAPDPGEPVLLTCRVYRLRDGRYSPTPDPLDVRDALRALLPAER